ncbi:effector-associated domain EAD1-containing protein [Anabaena sp. UHCC 0451]|uniref:effector-associated domain EAD1-containing protein n=1 Tax=Anabaena sp. UHCC 0451 TaxID=2055235 RepID=UPI002B1F8F4A|nr:effector-associated domain EAD1-containing protein [Anabaena sp. UHCC 0451]MEA5578307.1 effector-associated domain EAD1-containing protein [Anabaena sp. UHCC 0451]
MKLSSDARKQLLKVIIDSYPDIADLEILLRLELGENLDNIAGGSTNKQKVFKLIEWADTRGKLQDLLNAISQNLPDNIELQETLKILLEKSSQDNKINPDYHQDDQKSRNKKKIFLFLNLFLGILIIPIGIIVHKNFNQPRLSCDDTELQKKDNSIKIIISNFNGSISPRLENYLYQKFDNPDDQLTSNASKVVVCLTTNTKQKITNNLEARELGKQLFPKKSRDLVLIIWLNESTLTGGIEFINDNMPDIPLTFDLDVENNTRKILDNKFANKVYLFTSYGLSKIFYYKLNKLVLSQEYLHNALDKTVNCNIKKSEEIAKNQEIARLYFELGLFYEDQRFTNIEAALKSYECGLKIDNNANNIRFQIANIYNKKGEKSKAKLIYTELTNSDRVPSEIKSLSFAQIGILLAKESKCEQAEQEFNKSVASDLSLGLEVRASTRFFDCKKFEGAIEDLYTLCPEIDQDCQNILILYHDKLLQLEQSQQLYIVEKLNKLKQSQPKWKRIINGILENS